MVHDKCSNIKQEMTTKENVPVASDPGDTRVAKEDNNTIKIIIRRMQISNEDVQFF